MAAADAYPLPRTALGRVFEQQLGHPITPYLKWIFLTDIRLDVSGFLRRRRKQLSMSALAVLVPLVVYLLRRLRQKRLAAKQAEAEKEASAVPEGIFALKGLSGSGFEKVRLPTTFEMLRSPTGNMGFAELLGAIALCVGASGVMIWKSIVLGLLLARQNDTGLSWAWGFYVIQYPILCFFNVALFDSTGYLKRRIQIKWRRNVTHKLHDLYFSKMRYYRILNEDTETMITDPDIRICSDVNQLIGVTAEVTMALTMAVFFTVLFGSATISNRNWRWSLSSPVFVLVAYHSMRHIDGPPLWMAYGFMQWFSSRLTQILTRTQLHAERICMLQGEPFELHAIDEGLTEIAKHSTTIANLSFPRQVLDTFFYRSPDAPAAIEATAMVICTCMGANDVVATATRLGHLDKLPLPARKPEMWCGAQMAVMMRDMHGFFNSCSGWGNFIMAFNCYRDLHAITGRLKELFYKLQMLGESQAQTDSAVFSDDGPVISFAGCTIQTPTHQVLLKDLTFKVDQGSTLLICGHNGAGKSSIIRALCSLWPVPAGRISRPGGHVQAEENKQLHDEVYYLPQKPCNVLGSLSNQLTYPLSIPGGLPEEDLRRWLRYVGLEYLVDRKVGAESVSRVQGARADHNDIDWEVLLSMGEQQALSIARLLYHHPRFAILDECTSAVGRDLERRLFELAREIGISCVTITHRPALKEHHARMLQLTGQFEEDGKGWEMRDINDAALLPPVKPRCATEQEVHSRIEAFLAKRGREGQGPGETVHAVVEGCSTEYQNKKVASTGAITADSAVKSRWPSRIARIAAVVRLGLPTSKERTRAVKRLLVMAVLLRLRLWVFWYYWRANTGMLIAGFSGDRPQVLAEYVSSLMTGLLSACLEQGIKLVAEHMTLDLWKTTMASLPKRVLKNAAFLKMMNPPEDSGIPEVENPALRLSEVKSVFDAILGQINDVVVPLFQGMTCLRAMATGLGALSPFILCVNFLLFRGSQLVAPNFPEIQKQDNLLESRFQVLHTRLRSIAEPVAFSGGGDAERRIIEPHFEEVLKHHMTSARQETIYNMMVTAFTDYRQIPIWTHRIASMRYAMYNNPEHPDGVSGSIIVSNFLFDRTIQYPQVAVQKLVKLTEASGRIDGLCSRVLELVVACDAVEKEMKATVEATAADAKRIAVRGLDLVTRRGVCLAKGLDFSIEAGVPTVCTGPNASGKSLLGSVLLGLWRGEGAGAAVSIPGATDVRPPLGTIMPAPQQIYLPGGSLYEQLSYPVIACHPAGPPVTVHIRNPPAQAAEMQIHAMFMMFGCLSCNFRSDEDDGGAAKRTAVLQFGSLEGACYALAKPKDNLNFEGEELKCYWVEKREEAKGELPDWVLMRDCLKAVGIDKILTREDLGWLTSKEWSDALSGGEQQRLCLARVLYHRPTFGLLDECTSMVAADAEQELYRMLFRDWGITPITLTQRMFMPEFYKRELRLGTKDTRGWEYVNVVEEAEPERTAAPR